MNEPLPLIEVDAKGARKAGKSLRGGSRSLEAVERRASRIIEDVRVKGDSALRRYVREFDGFDPGASGLAVDSEELLRARGRVGKPLMRAMEFSLRRIGRTQGRLLERLSFSYVSDGQVVRAVARPLASVGCYIPGGKASYASTVLMTAGVAKLAGVRRIAICTPADKDGKVGDAILAAASLCGVDEVYRMGGAHSIAALAYGTKSVGRVAKVVGPGGVYSSVAKRLVSRDVPIDFFAGPTELVVVGDGSTDPALAAWDLVGQAEHGEDSLCGFVTWDEEAAERVRAEVRKVVAGAERRKYVEASLARGFTALCSDREAALELVNSFAPEHVEVLVTDAREFAARIEDAGLILVGKFSPCAASDYCVGTDHVIPTGGYAASRGGLSVLDFVKLNWVVEVTRAGLRNIVPSLKELAYAEGLPNHYLSAERRFKR